MGQTTSTCMKGKVDFKMSYGQMRQLYKWNRIGDMHATGKVRNLNQSQGTCVIILIVIIVIIIINRIFIITIYILIITDQSILSRCMYGEELV